MNNVSILIKSLFSTPIAFNSYQIVLSVQSYDWDMGTMGSKFYVNPTCIFFITSISQIANNYSIVDAYDVEVMHLADHEVVTEIEASGIFYNDTFIDALNVLSVGSMVRVFKDSNCSLEELPQITQQKVINAPVEPVQLEPIHLPISSAIYYLEAGTY